MRSRLCLAMAVIVAVGGASAVSAQGPSRIPSVSEPPAQTGCLRGRPMPACRTFWLLEMQGYTPLAQTTRNVTYSDGRPVAVTAFESTLEWNVGHMVNVAPNWAVGGVLSVGPQGGTGIFTGFKGRVRRWLSPDFSVEMSAGLLDAQVRYPPTRGATADLRLNIRDQGAFFVRWDGVSLDDIQFPDAGYAEEGGLQHAFSVGASAGSVPALIGTGALGLGYVIVLGLFLADAS